MEVPSLLKFVAAVPKHALIDFLCCMSGNKLTRKPGMPKMSVSTIVANVSNAKGMAINQIFELQNVGMTSHYQTLIIH